MNTPAVPATGIRPRGVVRWMRFAYLSDEQLRSVIDVSKPVPRTNYEGVAYEYPCGTPAHECSNIEVVRKVERD